MLNEMGVTRGARLEETKGTKRKTISFDSSRVRINFCTVWLAYEPLHITPPKATSIFGQVLTSHPRLVILILYGTQLRCQNFPETPYSDLGSFFLSVIASLTGTRMRWEKLQWIE